MPYNKNDADNKCPEKCKNCTERKIITHGVVPYNFCTKLNKSFCGGEPKKFFECGKGGKS